MSDAPTTTADESSWRFGFRPRLMVSEIIPWLRRIVSYCCLVLCLLFAALWVRSYGIYESIGSEPEESWSFLNAEGMVTIRRIEEMKRSGDWRYRWFEREPQYVATMNRRFWQTGVTSTSSLIHWFHIPHWLPVLTTLLLAIAIRLHPRWRFGLRDLFKLTTTAAAIIGPLAYWLRSMR